ncbi:MAG TPA: vitamin B12 dependent-methionine synthase activation domain-containing protein, partial [Rhodanobacteraceae bacterium]
VAQTLVSKELIDDFLAKVRSEYAEIRERHKHRGPGKKLVSLEHARAQKFDGDWANYTPPAPRKPGITVFDDYPLEELRQYLDWTPFFSAWELSGHYPAILDDAVVGAQARELFDDAQAMLDRLVAGKWLTARAVIGLWPANSVGDDVEIYLPSPTGRGAGGEGSVEAERSSSTEPSSAPDGAPSPEGRREKPIMLHHLRQQADKPPERPDFCLADFIAPKDSGKSDWIGGFAVTAGLGIEKHLERFRAEHDDYSAILLKALADRLAESFAERMHQRVRKEFWGYADDESLDNDALIAEKYRGVRPAPGYPACPDHTEKRTLFALLDATNNAGIELTEGMAMYPAAAVSGWYFSHPRSQYFVVGRLGKEQVEDYAKRKGWSVAEAERWLASNLDYDPE